MNKLILIFMMSVSVSALAITTVGCERSIAKIRQGNHSANLVYIEHGDGYANSGMQLTNIDDNEKIIDRTLSMLLAAHIAGKKITFSYINTGSGAPTCKPELPNTQQFIGVELE